MRLAVAGWPARQPVAALALLIVLALCGVALAPWLPLEREPLAPGTRLTIDTSLPGIDAAQLEQLVVLPIEEALSDLPRLTGMAVHTSDGSAAFELRFPSAESRNRAVNIAREWLAMLEPPLPTGMEAPAVERDDPSPRPAAVYAITAETWSDDLLRWAERDLRRPLHELTEITAATLEGVDTAEVLIQPDPRRLVTLGLSFDDVIHALRRTDTAPLRPGVRRTGPAAPASIEAIAARALKLPSGEPIALGEVAQVLLLRHPAGERPRYQGRPALLLRVTPRSTAQAADAARRVDAHLAWLRANGQVPKQVEVHKLFDEADETQKWFRRVLKRIGAALAVSLIAVLVFLGRRAAVTTLVALAVWLPLCGAVWWLAGMSLNAMTVAGAMLAGVTLVPLTVRATATPLVAALALAAAVAAWWSHEPFGVAAQTVTAFVAAAMLAIPVAWLVSGWRGADESVSPLVRWLPARIRTRAVLVPVMTVLLIAAVTAGVRSLPAAVADVRGGTVLFRVHGKDEVRLLTLVDEMAAALRALPDVSGVARAPVREERWQLQLDAERLLAGGVGIVDVGRAFEIAHRGLVVGELVDADAQLPLRLQLAPGASGAAFERLPLRGEHKERHALYLRDVGVAVRMDGWRERIRAQRQPAAELRAHWRGPQPPEALIQLRERVPMPAGYAVTVELTPLVADRRDLAP